jgi:hypothetical protein
MFHFINDLCQLCIGVVKRKKKSGEERGEGESKYVATMEELVGKV